MSYSSATARDSSLSKRNGRQRRKPTIWTREKIYKLIQLYQASDCLWNHYSELYKNKDCRNKAIDQICTSLGISKDAYGKKVHNLRNQFNSELKKYERRLQETGGKTDLTAKTCRWEHFETLMFLRPIIEPRPGYQSHSKVESPSKISKDQLKEIAQILRVEDVSDSAVSDKINGATEVTASKSETTKNILSNTCTDSENHSVPGKRKEDDCASGPSQSRTIRDQWDAFGELIANEFRNLNSASSQKKLKRKIMQIILEIGEEDDQKYTSRE
ncbi:hypothetical protein KR222_004102 [Zaprionus bogoriensis]|nr:hypothetical protein KR222_004102 [Zaprionus bogoriensis]